MQSWRETKLDMNTEREHRREPSQQTKVAPTRRVDRPRPLHFRRRRALWALGLEQCSSVSPKDEQTRN